jgi:hypothetical protein
VPLFEALTKLAKTCGNFSRETPGFVDIASLLIQEFFYITFLSVDPNNNAIFTQWIPYIKHEAAEQARIQYIMVIILSIYF